MAKKEVKFYTFVNGVQVIGQVDTENTKTLKLVNPCLMYFREEGLVLSLLLDPSVTDETTASFKVNNIMIDGIKANSSLGEHYLNYISDDHSPVE